MSEAYNFLVSKVSEEASSNPKCRTIANNLIQAGDEMTIDQLLEEAKKTESESKYKLSLIYFIIFEKYYNEAPKGMRYYTLYSHFLMVLPKLPQDCYQVVINPLYKFYYEGLCKELKSESILDLIVWTKVYLILRKLIDNVQPFENSLIAKIQDSFNSFNKDDNKSFEKCITIVNLVLEVQKIKFDFEKQKEELVNSIYNYSKNTIQSNEGVVRGNFVRVSTLFNRMKSIKINSPQTVQQIQDLNEILTSQNNSFQEGPINFDIKIASRISKIYPLNNQNLRPSAEVWLYSFKHRNNLEKAAVKIFNRNDENLIKILNNEREIIKKLSEFSKPDNCFLKFYGEGFSGDEAWFAMEYYEHSLKDEIVEKRRIKVKYTEGELKNYAFKLLTAFAIMEKKNIFHNDIKPQNILVTREKELKIIDFGISEKNDNERDNSITGFHKVQGTKIYMSPELLEAAEQNLTISKFRRNKADVFSLGLVLLELFYLKDHYALNHKSNAELLLNKIKKIEYKWLKRLLKKLLSQNYNERPTFSECLIYTEQDQQTM